MDRLAHFVKLVMRPPFVREPAGNRHYCAENEAAGQSAWRGCIIVGCLPQVEHLVAPAEEPLWGYSAPDDTRRVKDAWCSTSPLTSGIDLRAIKVSPFFVKDRDERDICERRLALGTSPPVGARCWKSHRHGAYSQFANTPRTVPRIWQANISRGGIEVYHPSLRSEARDRA